MGRCSILLEVDRVAAMREEDGFPLHGFGPVRRAFSTCLPPLPPALFIILYIYIKAVVNRKYPRIPVFLYFR